MFNTTKKNSNLYFDIIRELYYNKELSCVELSKLTDKSIPLITKSLNTLIAQGHVLECGYAPSSGGRRPLLYAINPEKLFIVTVAMDQLSTRVGMINLLNQDFVAVETFELKLKNNPDALNSLCSIISSYIDHTGISKEKIIGIGIGMPGFVNSELGINYTYLETDEQNIPSYLSKRINLPVFVDNDSSLIALSELRFGLAKSIKDVLVINLSWGIGLGIIINEQIFRGTNGFAGEFSHIPISEEGPLCTCGKQGCLEAEASLLSIAQKAIEGILKGKQTALKYSPNTSKMDIAERIMDVANEGDQYAIELLSQAGFKIGKGLSILIHIINPKAIIIS
ncbi:MAG: ROK family protein, partial [Flavobacterium sp.]